MFDFVIEVFVMDLFMKNPAAPRVNDRIQRITARGGTRI